MIYDIKYIVESIVLSNKDLQLKTYIKSYVCMYDMYRGFSVKTVTPLISYLYRDKNKRRKNQSYK